MMLALLYVTMQLIVHTLSFGEVTVHLKCCICSYTQSINIKLAGESLLPCTACEHLSCTCMRETLLLSLLREQPGLSMELHPALAQQVITVILC